MKTKLIIISMLALLMLSACVEENVKIPDKETACLNSGGTVEKALCCATEQNKNEGFPNLCLIGACGCAPQNSVEIDICNCGEGKCFDGIECVTFRIR